MRGITFVVIATAYVVSALAVHDDSVHSRYVDMAGDDSKLYREDLEAKPVISSLNEVTRNPDNNQYFLYTRRTANSSETLFFGDANSVFSSNFQHWQPTVVIVHGHNGNRDSDLNAAIRDAFLEVADANVIVMDWKRLAANPYSSAVLGVPAVGRGLGQFLRFLADATFASYDYFHLVGLGLGAHVVGAAGRELGGQIGRITGLDPAGRQWNRNSEALNASDAKYVEVIHTDTGLTGSGIGSAIGDVDFFPNGGNSQPGCLLSSCNHNKAWKYFAASVKYNHLLGRRCNNSLQMSLNTCRGAILPMGNGDVYKSGSPGSYRVNTGRSYPY